MIEDGAGDLLEADVEGLVNAVNTAGVMGKGIALTFKRAYPANFRAYRVACGRGELRLGRVWAFQEGECAAARGAAGRVPAGRAGVALPTCRFVDGECGDTVAA
jgi:O-acetyl-ADP-ribose deacetylase (regulator of RNase III)